MESNHGTSDSHNVNIRDFVHNARPQLSTNSVAIVREDLEKFAVSFVVEQTGYPEELVELDTNLEADLGIDSIKKAQLFGELQEYFDITPPEGLTLDDFPTLRHIVRFLADPDRHR